MKPTEALARERRIRNVANLILPQRRYSDLLSNLSSALASSEARGLTSGRQLAIFAAVDGAIYDALHNVATEIVDEEDRA